jgi:RNA recognition motif-containing protein
MAKKLFVGNLPFSVNDAKMKELFAAYGELGETMVVINKYSGRSKGFGFVTINDDAQAEKAKAEMNGKEIEGRKIMVNDATPFDPNKPRPERRSFGGDRGGYGGGRGGGRGFGGPRRSFGGDRGGFGNKPRFNDKKSDSDSEGNEGDAQFSDQE